MIDVHIEVDSRVAIQKAADAVSTILAGYKGVPVLFLVSGGSPMEIIKKLSPEGFDERITVGVSDERFSTDPLINNFAQLMETAWYTGIKSSGTTIIDSRPVAGETVEDSGKRFDAALKAWKGAHPDGKIVITQGIGLDGHTAGMMPASNATHSVADGPYPDDTKLFYELFDNPEIWAVGYDAKEKNKYPLRITTTLPFLRMVDDAVILAVGPDKKTPLENVLAREGSLPATPGRIIHQMKHCLLFTDQRV
jgi:6-phosphogluconolactonase/glucosamine-6-phosphate isomerase/deaminase